MARRVRTYWDYQAENAKAVARHRKAIELDPKDAISHNGLGSALKAQGKLDEAIACYQKAIELDPKYADAHSGLGDVLKAQGKFDEAIACYRKAIELDPKYVDAHGGLGDVLKAQGKFDEAIACYRRAIELNPKYDWAHSALDITLAQKGWNLANHPDPKLRDPYRAVELGKQAVELDPASIMAWQDLGWIQYRTENWRECIATLEKSCELEQGGDCGQWIVLALAHARLAAQANLPVEEWEHHRTVARRWFDAAVKQIDTLYAGDSVAQSIRAFRAEAAELLGVKDKEN